MLTNPLKVVFCGTPEFAVPSLECLLNDERFDVVAVFTQPDRASGRGQKITESPIKTRAREKGLTIYQPEKISATEISALAELQPDFVVTIAYGLILPMEFLRVPKFGCVNVHASLLPCHRGASPITAAILVGDTETGISFMQTIPKLDAGPVYTRAVLELKGDETTEELTHALAMLGGEKLPDVLAEIAVGKLVAEKQDETLAMYAPKIKKADGLISWRHDTPEILARKLRAYTPWPGLFTHHAGKVLKILALEPRTGKPHDVLAGTIFLTDGEVRVACFENSVALKKVQLEGRKALPIEEFVRGEKKFAGARLW